MSGLNWYSVTDTKTVPGAGGGAAGGGGGLLDMEVLELQAAADASKRP
ncbi:MAG TPA: hypothetical protein VKQ05_11355 [Gemmatimonadales bacterium]|nr:hypothetical protein [Gemmatimonadales bacterium]